jgi:hypothetical protein
MIPLDFVPFKYLIICLILCICLFAGFEVNFVSRLVIVAMPGLVDIDSQLKLPIIVCILFFSHFCFVVLLCSIICVKSTGYPDLHGNSKLKSIIDWGKYLANF